MENLKATKREKEIQHYPEIKNIVRKPPIHEN